MPDTWDFPNTVPGSQFDRAFHDPVSYYLLKFFFFIFKVPPIHHLVSLGSTPRLGIGMREIQIVTKKKDNLGPLKRDPAAPLAESMT